MRIFVLCLLVFQSVEAFSQSRDTDFLPSYEASRAAFRKLAKENQQRFSSEFMSIQIPSETDNDLTLDLLYIPPQGRPQGLVIVSSGVHGIEGFTGSAIQRTLIQAINAGSDSRLSSQGTGYLFLHGINPYGFKNFRRPEEHNIDLNRNFGDDEKLFEIKNEAYDHLEPMLNPTGRASASYLTHSLFLFRTVKSLLRYSYDTLNQAVAGGQYTHPKGIFFGGQTFAPQRDITRELLEIYSRPFDKVLILDLHTGYGKRGFMHLLPNPPDSKEISRRWRVVFGNYPIENVDSPDFYSNEGDFSTHASRFLESRQKRTVPMLVEYGTFNSHRTTGAIASLSRVILENQLHWHGAASHRSESRIRRNYAELFYPSSSKWRGKVMSDSKKWLPQFVENFRNGEI